MVELSDLTELLNTLGLDNSAIDKITGIVSGLSQAASEAGKLTGSITALGSSFESMLRTAVGSTEDMGEAVQRVGQFLDDFGAESLVMVEPLLNVLPKVNDLFGQVGMTGKEAGISISDSFSGVEGMMKRLGSILPGTAGQMVNRFAEVGGRLASAADFAQNLEQSFLRNAAVSGQLNTVLAATGADLAGMNDKLAQHSTLIARTADSTGKLSTEVASWKNQLEVIPGFLDEQIELVGDSTTLFSNLDAVMKVATGTQQTQAEVTELLNFAYRDLGITGQNALEIVAQIGMAAQDMTMPMDILRDTIKSVAGSFKLLGDNSAGAMEIVGEFSGALRDSGIGPRAIADLVGRVTEGIKNMDIAKKAFISGASGGPGGLAGAVVTLQDVGQDQALAGELMKQVTFLKEVAGVAGSDAEAYRILEVMKAGGAAKAPRTPEEALESAIDQGTKIQEAQTNELINIQNQMLEWSRFQAITSLNILRTLGGTAGEGPMANRVRDRMEAGREAAAPENRTKIFEAVNIGEEVDDLKSALPGLSDIAGVISTMGQEVTSQLDNILQPKLQKTQAQLESEQSAVTAEIESRRKAGSEIPDELLTRQMQLAQDISSVNKVTASPLMTGLMLAKPPTATEALALPERRGAAGERLPGTAGFAARDSVERTLNINVIMNTEHMKEIGRGEGKLAADELLTGMESQVVMGVNTGKF